MTIPDPTPTSPPEPRRRLLRAFVEAGIPVTPDRNGKIVPAFRVRPGDQVVQIRTVTAKTEALDPTGVPAVTITTDDGVSHTYTTDESITVWPPNTFPPLP